MQHLSKKTRRTIDQIYGHPTTHNLEWRDIRRMFEEVGQAEPEHNGNLKVTVSGQTVVFQSPQDSRVATEDEIHDIGRFMRGAKFEQSRAHHQLLVIDHQSAKLYRSSEPGSIPEKIVPYDPESHEKHVHTKNPHDGHAGQPQHHEYFEKVAEALVGDEPLLLFGDGHGSSSTMRSFVAWLDERHKVIAERVVQMVDVDLSHLSEAEMLEEARSM